VAHSCLYDKIIINAFHASVKRAQDGFIDKKGCFSQVREGRDVMESCLVECGASGKDHVPNQTIAGKESGAIRTQTRHSCKLRAAVAEGFHNHPVLRQAQQPDSVP